MRIKDKVAAIVLLSAVAFIAGVVVEHEERFQVERKATPLSVVSVAQAQAPAPAPDAKPDWSKKGRGYKLPPPEVRAKTHAAAFERHGHRMARHVRAMTAPATWDSRTLGWIPPIDDQGNCGDCYGVSAVDSTACAFTKAGYQKADGSFKLASQWGLDCGAFQGGCGGGDGPQVMDDIKSKGVPAEKYIDSSGKSVSDYPAYTARPGRCQLTAGMKLWKPADWLFVTSDQSDRAPTVDEVKAGVMNYGSVSFAFDASNLDTNVTRLGNQIDHEITGFIGWDDSKKTFICRNQWGASFGDGGYFYLAYSCLPQIREAYSVVAAPLPPPPGPGPTPPPVPPGPGPVGPVITSNLAAAANVGAAFSYQITASGSPTAFFASGLPDGLAISTATGLISGTPTKAGVSNVTVGAASSSGAGTATMVLTITTGPAPVPGSITITGIPPDVAKSMATQIANQIGAVVITGDMTLDEIIAAKNKVKAGGAQAPPCCQPPEPPKVDALSDRMTLTEKQIAALRKGMAAIMDRLDKLTKKISPAEGVPQ